MRNNISRRQLETLRLLAEGYQDKEIARRMGISFQTAKNHMRELRYKLKAENRVSLVIKLMENHKGEKCLFYPLLCQEGYCTGCYLYCNLYQDEDPEAK